MFNPAIKLAPSESLICYDPAWTNGFHAVFVHSDHWFGRKLRHTSMYFCKMHGAHVVLTLYLLLFPILSPNISHSKVSSAFFNRNLPSPKLNVAPPAIFPPLLSQSCSIETCCRHTIFHSFHHIAQSFKKTAFAYILLVKLQVLTADRSSFYKPVHRKAEGISFGSTATAYSGR